MRPRGLLGSLGVLWGTLGGHLVALGGAKGRPRSNLGAIWEPFWEHFEVKNRRFFVLSFLLISVTILESIWGRFGSDLGVIFELESGFRAKVWIFKNIGFT